jgi:hypothetical protein
MTVRKWSVSIDEDLAERVEERVGGRGLSGFVARAVEHELERDNLGQGRRPRTQPGIPRVTTTEVRIARLAGHLLAAIDAGSEMAIDALVVATAIRLGGGLILTHDPYDLERLAADYPSVRVVSV